MSDYLPPEVIEDILSRVPVQSLVRFRCVCKSWLSLITSPKFLTATANNGPKLLMLRSFSPKTSNDDYIFYFDNACFDGYGTVVLQLKSKSLYYRLVGTCNGLLCLYDCPEDANDNCSETIILWNPVLRRLVKLPRPSIDLPMAALGFGFDSKSNDFKVVRLACKRVVGRATPPMVEVFSLNSASWRAIPNGWDPSYGIVEDLWSQVYLNGSIHWLGYTSADRSRDSRKDRSILVASMDSADKFFRSQSYESTSEDGFCNVVLSFDLGEEVFRVIEIPAVMTDMFPLDLSLGLYGDSLALFQYDARLNCEEYCVYVMKKYGVVESWSCLFSGKDKEGIWTIFGFTDGDDILAATADNQICSYFLRKNKRKICCYSQNGYKTTLGRPGFKGSLYAGSFVETLALLDKVNDGLDGLLKSDEEVAASQADMEEENKWNEELRYEGMSCHYLDIAASLIGILLLY